MIYLILTMLILVIVELAVLVTVVIWRMCAGDRPSGGTVPPPSVPPASEKGANGHPQEVENEENRRKTEEYEKRWREGMDSMMGYDLSAARRAVRQDAEDEGNG